MFALALLLLAADASPMVTRPDWIERPTAEHLNDLYPAGARDREIEGRAVIECKVAADGRLETCKVLSETPAGEGFGEATLQAAPVFRMKPKQLDGSPAAGGTVRLPLRWTLAVDPNRRPLAERLAEAESCAGYAQARVPGLRGADQYDLLHLGLWTETFAGLAATADVKPSEITRRLEAARAAAAAKLAAGEAAPKACLPLEPAES